jgi:deazaflavin-dependent oxidoreductase (nitroreductase family)
MTDTSDMNAFNHTIIEEFRTNDGKVGGSFEGAPMMLLTTTGAKSGQPRVSPLVCQAGADGMIHIFASKAGAPTNPDWYHNLVANPKVTVEIGTETYAATAVEIVGADRDAIYAEQAERMPQFGEYQANTDRVIPVIALRRT